MINSAKININSCFAPKMGMNIVSRNCRVNNLSCYSQFLPVNKDTYEYILVILRAAALLTALIRTSHLPMLASSDSFTYRLAATRII